MGEVEVPADARWGAQTQRAVENFPISGQGIGRELIGALGGSRGRRPSSTAASASSTRTLAAAIAEAAAEVAAGDWDDQFPVDVFQTGSGTSSNMNANEVLAGLAAERLGRAVHPNDHVNASQSSNDVFPSAVHLAVGGRGGHRPWCPPSRHLADVLRRRAADMAGRGQGRAHPPDGRHAGHPRPGARGLRQRGRDGDRAAGVLPAPAGRAGPGRHRGGHRHQRPARVRGRPWSPCWSESTGLPLREARDHFEAQGGRDALVEASGMLRTVAISLVKMANDLRWMASGPATGLAEIHLPDLQPGSSIMPGKVNPVIPEVVVQVAAQVIGNDAAVAFAGSTGAFELNVAVPVMARNLLESVRLLAAAARVLADRCVDGIEADVDAVPPLRRVVTGARHRPRPPPRLRGGGGRSCARRWPRAGPCGRSCSTGASWPPPISTGSSTSTP